ncbi:hypothetical protein SAMD00019534_042590 [Acytostelium subglobosum LB1]|uniref:hypothetical protein n=1 Tax=Acytostelium subglobosum LB1 TaxID=1410327 RepID=UPI0006451A15|nr:hypothetical protein SAMD00019534_042590 [Acytostelium subglobosum LB1]GAM21084.1 hypothetical protein SAMD00019534_042590 [Acytostelium subglobosum LB1]|eukprot:XP_012756218.1 hypothetical protein SAMD00019534_042590 [Acytostelium subglobosum LB1]
MTTLSSSSSSSSLINNNTSSSSPLYQQQQQQYRSTARSYSTSQRDVDVNVDAPQATSTPTSTPAPLEDVSEWAKIGVNFNITDKGQPADELIKELLANTDGDIFDKCQYIVSGTRDWTRTVLPIGALDLEKTSVNSLALYTLINVLNGRAYEVGPILALETLDAKSRQTIIISMIVGYISWIGRMDIKDKDAIKGMSMRIVQLMGTLGQHDTYNLLRVYAHGHDSVLSKWMLTLEDALKDNLQLDRGFFARAIYMALPFGDHHAFWWIKLMAQCGIELDNALYTHIEETIIAQRRGSFSVQLKTLMDFFAPLGVKLKKDTLFKLTLSELIKGGAADAGNGDPTTAPAKTGQEGEDLDTDKESVEAIQEAIEKELSDSPADIEELYKAITYYMLPINCGVAVQFYAKAPSLPLINKLLKHLADSNQTHLVKQVLAATFKRSPDRDKLPVNTMLELVKHIQDPAQRSRITLPLLLALDPVAHSMPEFFEQLIDSCVKDIEGVNTVAIDLFERGFKPSDESMSVLIKRFPGLPWADMCRRYNLPLRSSHYLKLMKVLSVQYLEQYHARLKSDGTPIDTPTFYYLFNRYVKAGHLPAVRLLLEESTPADLTIEQMIDLLHSYKELPVGTTELSELLSDDAMTPEGLVKVFDIAVNNAHFDMAHSLLGRLTFSQEADLLHRLQADLLVAAAEREPRRFIKMLPEMDLNQEIVRHAALFSVSQVIKIPLSTGERNALRAIFDNHPLTDNEWSMVVVVLEYRTRLAKMAERGYATPQAIANIILSLCWHNKTNATIKSQDEHVLIAEELKKWIVLLGGSNPSHGQIDIVLSNLPRFFVNIPSNIAPIMDRVRKPKRLSQLNMVWLVRHHISKGQYYDAIKVITDNQSSANIQESLILVDEMEKVNMQELLSGLNKSPATEEMLEHMFLGMSIVQPNSTLSILAYLQTMIDQKKTRFTMTTRLKMIAQLALADDGDYDLRRAYILGLDLGHPLMIVAKIRSHIKRRAMKVERFDEYLHQISRSRPAFKSDDYALLFCFMAERAAGYPGMHKMIDTLYKHMVGVDPTLKNDQDILQVLCTIEQYRILAEKRLMMQESNLPWLQYGLLRAVMDYYHKQGNTVALTPMYLRLLKNHYNAYEPFFHNIQTRLLQCSMHRPKFYAGWEAVKPRFEKQPQSSSSTWSEPSPAPSPATTTSTTQ